VAIDLNLDVSLSDDERRLLHGGLGGNAVDEAKEWLWTHKKKEILAAMKVDFDRNGNSGGGSTSSASTTTTAAVAYYTGNPQDNSTQRQLRLLDQISQVQRQYFQQEEAAVVFGGLLDRLLDLMESEYGFIGEIKFEDGGETMFLQTHAITNIAWNAETRAFYEENRSQGLKFYNLDSLFGNVMTLREPVISNNPRDDPRGCGVPRKFEIEVFAGPYFATMAINYFYSF